MPSHRKVQLVRGTGRVAGGIENACLRVVCVGKGSLQWELTSCTRVDLQTIQQF